MRMHTAGSLELVIAQGSRDVTAKVFALAVVIQRNKGLTKNLDPAC